jgi:hypothetical protein
LFGVLFLATVIFTASQHRLHPVWPHHHLLPSQDQQRRDPRRRIRLSAFALLDPVRLRALCVHHHRVLRYLPGDPLLSRNGIFLDRAFVVPFFHNFCRSTQSF